MRYELTKNSGPRLNHMARTKSNGNSAPSSATIGFEAKLWLTADKLRNNMEAVGSRTLATLRDTLPPKLLSGELPTTKDTFPQPCRMNSGKWRTCFQASEPVRQSSVVRLSAFHPVLSSSKLTMR